MIHAVCNLIALPFRLAEWARIQSYTYSINALLGPEDPGADYVSRTTAPRPD